MKFADGSGREVELLDVIQPIFCVRRARLFAVAPHPNPDVDELIRFNILGCDHPVRVLVHHWLCSECKQDCPAPDTSAGGQLETSETKTTWRATPKDGT